MIFKENDFNTGRIVYDDMNIDPNLPIEDQIDELKEDLFQVDFDGKYLIDIGWYPCFNIEGKFIVYLLENDDWENPIEKRYAKTFDELKYTVDEIVEIVVVARKNKPDDDSKQ